MSKLPNALAPGLPDSDLLVSYRTKIWTLIGAVCIFVFFPGAIYIFLDGHRLLAVSVVCMLATFGLNGYCVFRGKAQRTALFSFVVALSVTVGLCIVERGSVGTFWAFPAVLMITFLAFGRSARIYTAIFFVSITAVQFYALEPEVAARGTVGLLVTVLITNIFLGVIDKLQKALVERSGLDPLTGALNRRELDSILQDAIERKRRTNTPASLIALDVDDFKSVNDTFGHAVGDHVLKELTVLLQDRARHLDRLFRLGGEEFMLLLPDTAADGAMVLAEELRTMIADAALVLDRQITISVGISSLNHGETIDEWMRRTDDALYQAKSGGRNRSVAFDHDEPGATDYIIPFPTVRSGATV